MNKILVTSGCSFTENSGLGEAWPSQLNKIGKFTQFYNEGQAAQSNKLIKLRAQYRISELLKIYKPEEITVGIMWTGFDRTAIFTADQYTIDFVDNSAATVDRDFLKPFNFIENARYKWVPLVHDHLSADHLHRPYYSKVYNNKQAILELFMYISDMQNYLERVGVNYFMSTAWNLFQYECDGWCNDKEAYFPNEKLKKSFIPLDALNDENYSWIIDSIDFEKFLKVEGLWEYTYNINPNRTSKVHHHPTGEEHLQYTREYILPHLNIEQNII